MPKKPNYTLFLSLIIFFFSCESKKKSSSLFDKQLAEFKPYSHNPVFTGADSSAWDNNIRERGFILFEDSTYKLWYTGYQKDGDTMRLGYATSKDGLHWERYPGNPISTEKWTEDMFVFKHDGRYYMYAEGYKDVAHYMISDDGIHWEEQGDLIILKTTGDTIPGPYGTPVVWVENGKWHLFYERNDEGIWHAMSDDKKIWRNVSDEPVLKPGPEKYDLGAVAANQIVKYNNRYYLYYHANADPGWMSKPTPWSSNVASSDDLVQWKKYEGNPIVEGDHSSPIILFDGEYKLYTMHPDVNVYYHE